MSLRDAIRDKLMHDMADTDPNLDIGDQIYEVHAADVELDKPFVILRSGVEGAPLNWQRGQGNFEVWPYTRRYDTFTTIDTLSHRIKESLHLQLIVTAEGEKYKLQHDGSEGRDFIDRQYDALTHGIRFNYFNLGWLSPLTYEPDPVGAMRRFTEEWLPPLVTDPESWFPTDTTPAVYWRLEGFPSQDEILSWGAWMMGSLRGHVLTTTEPEMAKWVRKITDELSITSAIRMNDHSPMFVERVMSDVSADPFRMGQIRLEVRFGKLRSTEPSAPVLQEVRIRTTGPPQ